MSARLAERGVAAGPDEPELVLLCVPDRAIAEVAAGIRPGPWVAHVSGATPLAALEPHRRRFSLHPFGKSNRKIATNTAVSQNSGMKYQVLSALLRTSI